MEKPRRMCNNCSTVYSGRLLKCPTKGCRAPRRFSCEEPDDLRRARLAADDAREALLEDLLKNYA